MNTELKHTCPSCGTWYWDFDVPRGHCAITEESANFCDVCGEHDNFIIEEVEYHENAN